jgi:hypothetical protein
MTDSICPRCRKPLLPDQSLILIGTQWAHVDCESSDETKAAHTVDGACFSLKVKDAKPGLAPSHQAPT